SRTGSSGSVMRACRPVRHPPTAPLGGTNTMSFRASAEVAVARSPARCRTSLRLTALDGERAVVPVNIPALPQVPLYDTASPAGQAIYITVDAGSPPSPQLLN